MIIGFYNRIKYGSKDWEYVEETKRGIFGLIGLFVMAILMYLFISVTLIFTNDMVRQMLHSYPYDNFPYAFSNVVKDRSRNLKT